MTNTLIWAERGIEFEEGFMDGDVIIKRKGESVTLSPKELKMIHHAYELYRLKCNYRAD